MVFRLHLRLRLRQRRRCSPVQGGSHLKPSSYDRVTRTREILVSVTFRAFRHVSSLFVLFPFRPFSIATRRTKKNHKEDACPLSFFWLAGSIDRPSRSTQIDDLTMTRWRKFRIGEKHHNACYPEILLTIRVLHVFNNIG